jgi:hypothetical protein
MYSILETNTEFIAMQDDSTIESFPMKPWEHSCNSLARIRAIECVRKHGRFGTYFDFSKCMTTKRK